MILTSEITKTVVDTDKIEKLIRDLLDERFGDEIVFDPIEISTRVFDDGETADDFLQIYIVFEGDYDQIPASWTSGLVTLIRPALMEMGWEYPVGKSFIEKSEWEENLRYRKEVWGR